MPSDLIYQLTRSLHDLEDTLHDKGYATVCGVDEVGRGPLAGPVVAAAVIMPHGLKIDGLDDSKRLPGQVREELFEEIASLGIVCAVGIVDNRDIDRINILRASLTAMRKAINDLDEKPDFLLIDGNFPVPNVTQPQFSVVGGDGICQSIAAASIVAKVTRDRIMDHYEELYPAFTFSRHRGYTTPGHLRELRKNGPCDIHRRTFAPVAALLHEEVTLFDAG